MTILRGDPALLVAMGDDRDIFLDWLQSSGLNAVNASVVYVNTDNWNLTAIVMDWETTDQGNRIPKLDADGFQVNHQETYVLTPPDQRVLGRWLGYLDVRLSEAKTFVRSST